MNTYSFSISLQVSVEAFDVQDALEALEDVFGPGDSAGLNVTNLKVNNVAEL